MIPARCLTSFNRFQLPSSEATPWLLQPHHGNMSRSCLRDTDSQNGDALLCIYYINDRLHVNKQTMYITLIYVLLLLMYTQVFLRVQFLALYFSPCILSLCQPLLTHTIIHHSFANDLQIQMSAPPDRLSELFHL